jgi:hypothetical protein
MGTIYNSGRDSNGTVCSSSVSVKQMILDLEKAGWKRKNSFCWIAPFGEFYRGPVCAWNVMKTIDANSSEEV